MQKLFFTLLIYFLFIFPTCGQALLAEYDGYIVEDSLCLDNTKERQEFQILSDFQKAKNSIISQQYSKIVIVKMSKNYEQESVKPSGIVGLLNTLDKKQNGDAVGNFLDLGAKYSNFKIGLHPATKFVVRDDTLFVTMKRKDLRFDIINRGVISFDDIKYSINEYINSIQGSPITLRFSNQVPLDRKRKRANRLLGLKQPEAFFIYGLDLRGLPLPFEEKNTVLGKSANLILTYANQSPLSTMASGIFDQKVYFQVSANIAYFDKEIRNKIVIDHDRNLLFSFEAVAGILSNENTLSNLSASFVFRPYKDNLVGSPFNFSLNFSPQ